MDRRDVIPPGQNEVADQAFIAVDDKVAAKFLWLLVACDELS
jgi:hypothetical protein